MKLKVEQLRDNEVHRDIVRVFENARINKSDGKIIPEETVCKITVLENGRSTYAILRGNKNEEKIIRLDEYLRNKLGIILDAEYEFIFSRAGWFGQYLFAWYSTEAGYRISSKIALISLILGILSLIIALRQECLLSGGFF